MADTPDFLAHRLLQEGEKTKAFFETLQEDDWNKTVYSEGSNWTVRQVLAHFAAAEDSITRLIKHILDGGAGTPDDFDLDAYNERKVVALDQATPGDLIEQFVALRHETARFVSGLSPEDLQRTGKHPWLGVAHLVDIIKLMYRHNQIHIRDIRKLDQ